MKYRPHFGSYEAAIAKMEIISPTLYALSTAIKNAYLPCKLHFELSDLVIGDCVYDERIPWEAKCYIVHIPAAKPLGRLSVMPNGLSYATIGVLGYVDEIPVDYQGDKE